MPNVLASLSSASSAAAGIAPARSDAKGAADTGPEDFDQLAQEAADTEQSSDTKSAKIDKAVKGKTDKDTKEPTQTSDDNKKNAPDDAADVTTLSPPQQPQPQVDAQSLVAPVPALTSETGGNRAQEGEEKIEKKGKIEDERSRKAAALKTQPTQAQMIASDTPPRATFAGVPAISASASSDPSVPPATTPSVDAPATRGAFTVPLSGTKADPILPQGASQAVPAKGDIPPETVEVASSGSPALSANATPTASRTVKAPASQPTDVQNENEAVQLLNALEALGAGQDTKIALPQKANAPKQAVSGDAPENTKKTPSTPQSQSSPAVDPASVKLAGTPSNDVSAPSFAKHLDNETFAVPAPRSETSPLSAQAPIVEAHNRPLTSTSMISVRTQTHEGQIHLPTEQIAIAITRQSRQGNNRFEIRLDPPELGHIHVRLEVGSDGRATASLTADRQDTLDLMTRDSRTLQKTLADAGFNTDGDALRFSLREDGGSSRGNRFSRQDPQPSKDASLPNEPAPVSVITQISASLGLGRLDLRV